MTSLHSPGSAVYIGVDIGGTKITLAEEGASLTRCTRVPTPQHNAPQRIVEIISEFVKGSTHHVEGIGIGTTGIVAPATGTITAASNAIPDWVGFPLKHYVQGATGLNVEVINDVNAFALNAAHESNARSLIGIMLGTGVGGGVIIDGKAYGGEHGSAFEIGHIPGFGNLPCTCGGTGHLESVCGGKAIANRYRELTGLDEALGAREIAERAEAGDAIALQLFHDCGRALGIACCQAATLFDIDTIALGGGVLTAWSLIATSFDAALANNPLISGRALQIHHTHGQDEPVLRGAVLHARAMHSI